MRKIFLICAWLFTALSAQSIEETYLKDGLTAVKNKIEANLKSYEFWQKDLKNKDVRYGYYSSPTKLIVVSKQDKQMSSFEYGDGILNKRFSQTVITGKSGDKKVEGDLKTPVGVYDILKKFTPPSDYYGPVAFELSYPNSLDKLAKKSGSGIWIHGLPMTGKRDNDYNTKGCVAFENESLKEFAKIVGSSGVVMISETKVAEAKSDHIALILSSLFEWKDAWEKNHISAYLKFYADDFTRFDGMGISSFKDMKTRIFSKKEAKEIKFSSISITPYPNVKEQNLFRVSFYEDYSAPSYKFKGWKELYVRVDGDKFKIIVEE